MRREWTRGKEWRKEPLKQNFVCGFYMCAHEKEEYLFSFKAPHEISEGTKKAKIPSNQKWYEKLFTNEYYIMVITELETIKQTFLTAMNVLEVSFSWTRWIKLDCN